MKYTQIIAIRTQTISFLKALIKLLFRASIQARIFLVAKKDKKLVSSVQVDCFL